MTAKDIQKVLRSLANPEIAEHSQHFFKTGIGEYGEGDKFLGIRIPMLRKLLKEFKTTSLKQILILLKSAYHEERLFSLLLLVDKFKISDVHEKAVIYDLYINNTKYINNWDLVDSSANHIAGAYLDDKDKQPIYQLALSDSLWERRIAIISTFHLIRKNEFYDALEISALLLGGSEDLVHKAVGWMLREIGKRDITAEKTFLDKHYKEMPRTMLRYAIERFQKKERKAYLNK